MVIRKSEFTSDRTLAIKADKSSENLARRFVKQLCEPKTKVKITLTAKVV